MEAPVGQCKGLNLAAHVGLNPPGSRHGNDRCREDQLLASHGSLPNCIGIVYLIVSWNQRMDNSSAVVALEQWFATNREIFADGVVQAELSPASGRDASIQLGTRDYLISICAWDQGSSLEIQIIDRATTETSIQDGPCSDMKELRARLEQFLSWYVLQNE